MKKTQLEIEELKRQWLSDGCWDIEATEGFEAHRDELLLWRMNHEITVQIERTERLEARATQLGCSVELVEYLERLEQQIRELREAR